MSEYLTAVSEQTLLTSFKTLQFTKLRDAVAVGNMAAHKLMSYKFSAGLWSFIASETNSIFNGDYQDVNGNKFSFINDQQYWVLSFGEESDHVYFQINDERFENFVLRKKIKSHGSVNTDDSETLWFVMGSMTRPNIYETLEVDFGPVAKVTVSEPTDLFIAYLNELMLHAMAGSTYQFTPVTADVEETKDVTLTGHLTFTGTLAPSNLHFRVPNQNSDYSDMYVHQRGMSYVQADSTAELIFSAIRMTANKAAGICKDANLSFEILRQIDFVLNNRQAIVQTLMAQPGDSGAIGQKYMVYEDYEDTEAGGGITQRLHQVRCKTIVEALQRMYQGSYHGIMIEDSSDQINGGWRVLTNQDIADELKAYTE